MILFLRTRNTVFHKLETFYAIFIEILQITNYEYATTL